VQSRVQSEVLRQLADSTTLVQVPRGPFSEFAWGRFEQEMQEAIQKGIIPKSEIEKYSSEEYVNAFVEERRDQLEGEFRAMLALDKVYAEEKLTVDEDLVQAQAASLLKEAHEAGQKDMLVRRQPPCALRRATASTCHATCVATAPGGAGAL
jgi:FKBP-type peptidyl-prolyl cis-trans isomerase (trigger factor)